MQKWKHILNISLKFNKERQISQAEREKQNDTKKFESEKALIKQELTKKENEHEFVNQNWVSHLNTLYCDKRQINDEIAKIESTLEVLLCKSTATGSNEENAVNVHKKV